MKLLYKWNLIFVCVVLVSMPTPTNTLSQQLTGLLSNEGTLSLAANTTQNNTLSPSTANTKIPTSYTSDPLLDKTFSQSRKFFRNQNWRTLIPNMSPRGYKDTSNYISLDMEPINLNVVGQVESGNNRDAVSRTGALGIWQVIPKTQIDLPSGYYSHGATALTDATGNTYFNRQTGKRKINPTTGKEYTDKDFNDRWKSMTEIDQRIHVNNYMKGAVGHYEINEKQSPGASRALAIASYNAGFSNVEKTRKNPKGILSGTIKDKNKQNYAGKMYQLRGYLGKFLAEGELTATEILEAFLALKNNFNLITDRALAYDLNQGTREKY